MENKKSYFANIGYSIYMGIIMGFIITSIFLVIITNLDKYFFDSYLGIRGDWLYYTGTALLVPMFGFIYVFNRRVTIENKKLILRENSFSFSKSVMDMTLIKSISLHKQEGRRRIKKGIKFTDGKIALMIIAKPFSDKVISSLLHNLQEFNPEIHIDDYFKKIMK